MNTNMLPVFAYLFNWYTHLLNDMLANECFCTRVWTVEFVSRHLRSEKDVSETGSYTRTRNSDHLDAWDIRIQLERSE